MLSPCLATGGAENQLYELATRLDRSRFDPLVWTAQPDGIIGEALRRAGVPVVNEGLNLSTCEHVDAAVDWLAGLGARLVYSFECGPLMEDAVLAKTAGVPLFVSRRDNTRFWDPDQKVTPEEEVRNAETDLVVACSRAMREIAINVEGLPEERVRVIHNGVPMPQRREASQGSRIGNVANYRPIKGHAELLNAFDRVARQYQDASLHLAGRGAPQLTALIEGCSASNRVYTLGEVTERLDDFYRGLAVYVQPSWSEGLSVAVLEAMSHGVPVVVSDVGGMSEVVEDGVTGFLVKPGDVDAVEAAIRRLLGDEELRMKLGESARGWVEREFSVEQMVARHEALFAELAG